MSNARTQFAAIVAKARLTKQTVEGVVFIAPDDALVPCVAFDTLPLTWEHRPSDRIARGIEAISTVVYRYEDSAAALRGAQRVTVRAWAGGRVRVIGGVVAS